MDQNRREFLNSAGLAAVSGVTGGVFGALSQAWISGLSARNFTRHILRDQIEAITSSDIDELRFTPGASHPEYSNFHPDDEYVIKFFDSIINNVFSNVCNYDIRPEIDDCDGTIIAAGGPVSNALIRDIFQYKFVEMGKPQAGLVRAKNPIIELPFELALDSRELIAHGISARDTRFGMNEYPIWSVKNNGSNNDDDRFITPFLKEGRICNSYLLITVLPNTINKNYFYKDRSITIISGTQGVATRAIETVLMDDAVMEKLKIMTRRLRYWQALIEIDNISHNFEENGKYRSHSISVNRNIKVGSINFSPTRISRWIDAI